MLEAAIIGAGPYGLSIAAHFRALGIPHRIFGRPMDSWVSHMPKGMLLKSDGFASNLSDPRGGFSLKRFCLENGIDYADMGNPVRLETFSAYGRAFQERMVPDLEEKLVANVDRSGDGFVLTLDDGEEVSTKRVIFAVGITHFRNVPAVLQQLPGEFLSHSFQVSDVGGFRGRRVVLIGAGSSAIDLAALLYEAGADVQLVARAKALLFHEKMPMDKPRSLWQKMRSPLSGLGPGIRSRIFADAPALFRYLPENYRLETVRTFLGPAGGWFAKEKVIGKVPLVLGFSLERAEVLDHHVSLQLRSDDGNVRNIESEHVIAATGYKVDVSRLKFLSPALRDKIRLLEGAPILSSSFESSIPGLYFVGLAAANSFGPVMRFACGAGYTARTLSREMARLAAATNGWSPTVRLGNQPRPASAGPTFTPGLAKSTETGHPLSKRPKSDSLQSKG
jgi:Pyridine nucleotide-disulphide oxidoreductase